jgi:hypothetical protein
MVTRSRLLDRLCGGYGWFAWEWQIFEHVMTLQCPSDRLECVVPDSTKTLADQIREIDKLVNDGMDSLLQAKIGLRSLEQRLQELAQDSHAAPDGR